MIEEKIVSFGYGYYRVFWDSEKQKHVNIKVHLLENKVTRKDYKKYITKGTVCS